MSAASPAIFYGGRYDMTGFGRSWRKWLAGHQRKQWHFISLTPEAPMAVAALRHRCYFNGIADSLIS